MRACLLSAVCLAVLAACGTPKVDPPVTWKPGMVYETPRSPNARGFLDRRGMVHAHSYFSHDACDGMPKDANGNYDQVCYEDFRRGLCQTKHDFVFLTDHPSLFDDNESPDTLLYRADHGDTLVDHGAGPTANWLACPDAPPALVMAGCESGDLMPVGLDHHVTGRGAVYGDASPTSMQALKDAGAVVLVAHTESRTVDDLVNKPFDGFEMFNLHANAYKNADILLMFAVESEAKRFDGLPDPDAFLTGFDLEDPAYLTRWGSVLARGVKRTTTLGTDCHRNSFPTIAADGERIDSYRRMMMAFSNHLLVKPEADGSWNDLDVKEALKAGRLYGVFDAFGTPVGFDFVGHSGNDTREMGEDVSLAAGARLSVTAPTLKDLDPAADAPDISLHVFRAIDGGWDEVASSTESSLDYTPKVEGAYRAEVRIVPRHLKAFLGKSPAWLRAERPWVYSNAIYVVP